MTYATKLVAENIVAMVCNEYLRILHLAAQVASVFARERALLVLLLNVEGQGCHLRRDRSLLRRLAEFLATLVLCSLRTEAFLASRVWMWSLTHTGHAL